MICVKYSLGLLLYLAIGARPHRVDAQSPVPQRADSDLRKAIVFIAADNPRQVRIFSDVTGRVEGDSVALLGDSLVLTTASGVRTIPIADVDSVWTHRGTAAQLIGIIAALPCAVYGAMVGSFIGGDPDGKPSSGREVGLTIAGFAAGAIICGSVGAAVGSTIRRWQLEYARAET